MLVCLSGACRCERYRGTLFLLALPLGLVQALLGWQWQVLGIQAASDGFNELARFVFYGLVFMYG